MNNTHGCTCVKVCDHENLKYCPTCKKVYCMDCRKEWEEYPSYPWTFREPTYPSYPITPFYIQSSTTTGTCH